MLAVWYHTLLATLFVIICSLLVLVILLQKGRGKGLGAAFGGGAGSAFGTRTGDVFTWITIVLTVLFILMAIGTQMAFRPPATQVLPPIFDPPPPGLINEENVVTIICETPGAAIYYTTDGTTPTDQSAGYDNELKLSPDTTLKAIATRPGRVTSRVSFGTYGKEPEAPALPGLEGGELELPGDEVRVPAGSEE